MGDGPVKIGKAKNPQERLTLLNVGCPEELRLLGSAGWPDEQERVIHRILRTHRVRGEWFAPTPEVMEVVERIRQGGLPLIPPAQPKPSPRIKGFAVTEPHNRWAREKYNAYQRFLMQTRRAIAKGLACRWPNAA
jgi:hypothetical protein